MFPMAGSVPLVHILHRIVPMHGSTLDKCCHAFGIPLYHGLCDGIPLLLGEQMTFSVHSGGISAANTGLCNYTVTRFVNVKFFGSMLLAVLLQIGIDSQLGIQIQNIDRVILCSFNDHIHIGLLWQAGIVTVVTGRGFQITQEVDRQRLRFFCKTPLFNQNVT